MLNPLHAQKTLRHLNAFINVPSELVVPEAVNGPLSGLAIAVKDNICTVDFPTTCGSRGLEEYTSPYDATVVARLRAAGALIAGKTNLDEFGMGSHSMHSAFGPVQNKLDSLSSGGSSGGSAVAVATGQCHAALGTDTGGSVRLPGAYNGVYGFKPSYGLVSRWGVVAYANSLDTVGFVAPDVSTVRLLFETLSAHDRLDPTNLTLNTRNRLSNLIHCHRHKTFSRPLRIGVPVEYNITSLSASVRQAWRRALNHLRSQGHTLHTVSLPTTRQALSAYYVLAPAEASSNLAKYDGVRYGMQFPSSSTTSSKSSDKSSSSVTKTFSAAEAVSSATPSKAAQKPQDSPLYASTRHQSFHPEVRRRILLGTYTLSSTAINNYFLRAQRVRRLVQEDFDRVFALPNVLITKTAETSISESYATSTTPKTDASAKQESNAEEENQKVDVLLTPTAPTLPPTITSLTSTAHEPTSDYATDVFTVPASLAGLPAISVPITIDESLARAEMQAAAARENSTNAEVVVDGDGGGDVPQSAGVQVIAQYGDDELCLRVADMLKDVATSSVIRD